MSVAQVFLLCGRSYLLHRVMGCWRTSWPALNIRLGIILLHSPRECKQFFAVWCVPGCAFLLCKVRLYQWAVTRLPATDGAGYAT